MKLSSKKKPNIINNMTWKIAGEAGFGIAVSGVLFSKICTRGGLFVHSYSEYPSLIRGGHNTFQLTVRDSKVYAPFKTVNFLIALNKESVTKHLFELSEKALIMFDPDENDIATETSSRKDLVLCPVPLAILSKNSGADRLMRNTVAMGASMAILAYDLTILDELFKEVFADKGQEVIDLNIRAAKAGFDYIKEHFDNSSYPYRLEKNEKHSQTQMVLGGNEAIGMGAIKAGVKFYAGYPMTPSSTLLQYMASKQLQYNIVVKHTEDEISAANMAIGAYYAGVRAMTGTAGGGFSLMVESLGLAAITETPMVYVVVQRPGPATGLPTWTDQGDLKFVLHASQGEFPRIVVAPGDTEECFYVTIQAHNLAETYQLPVIILSDKFLAESPKSTYPFDDKNIKIQRGKIATPEQLQAIGIYKRFDLQAKDGVSLRTLPGMKNGIFLANSDEHDEHGFSNEESEMRINMVDKRFKKFIAASAELPEPVLYGPAKADFTIFAWGSTKGPILEAMEILRRENVSVNLLHILYISPFPAKRVNELLEICKTPILIENNMTAQLGSLISEYTGYEIGNKILKYDGRPFFPEELVQRIRAIKNQKGLKKWLA